MESSSRHSDHGSILILTALALVAMMAMTGLAIEASYMYSVRDRMGAAADVAAKAGAFQLARTSNAAALTTFGRDAAARVGFTDGVDGVSVTINNPPTAGPFAGNASYVEAIVTQPMAASFMRVLGWTTTTVGNRASAGGSSAPPCVLSLDSSDNDVLNISASPIVAIGCTIAVNSTNADSANCSGATNISGATINLVGNSTNCSTHISGPPPSTLNTGTAATADPFSSLPAPTLAASAAAACAACSVGFAGGGCDAGGGNRVYGTATVNQTGLTPGIYCFGISSTVATGVTMATGTYILYGRGGGSNSLNVSGSGQLSGTNVLIYNTGTASGTYAFGDINISGGSVVVNLSAPTSGTYAGVLFFQDRLSTRQFTVAGGSSNVNLTGTIYAPAATVLYSGGSGGTAPYTFIISKAVSFTGGSTLRNDISGLSGGIFSGVMVAE